MMRYWLIAALAALAIGAATAHASRPFDKDCHISDDGVLDVSGMHLRRIYASRAWIGGKVVLENARVGEVDLENARVGELDTVNAKVRRRVPR